MEPIVVDLCQFFGHTTDDNGCFGHKKCVVMHVHPCASYGCFVFAVTPAMHVKTVAERMTELNVVTGFVTTARTACARDGVAVVIEEVVGNARLGHIVGYAVTEAVVLVVVNEVVVDVVVAATAQKDGGAAPACQFTVVYFYVVVFDDDAIGGGEFVIIVTPVTFGKGSAMVFEARVGVGALQT